MAFIRTNELITARDLINIVGIENASVPVGRPVKTDYGEYRFDRGAAESRIHPYECWRFYRYVDDPQCAG